LKVIGSQSRPESATAIQHHFGVELGDPSFYVALNNAFAQVNRARQVVFGKLAFFANIHEQKFIAAIEPLLDRIDIRFAYAGPGIVDNLEKTWRMLMSHANSFVYSSAQHRIKAPEGMEILLRLAWTRDGKHRAKDWPGASDV
jgi:hypothetical protein